MKIPVKRCQLCGALVADRPDDIALHTTFHGKLKKTSPVVPVVPGSTAVLGTNVPDDENAAALSSLAHGERPIDLGMSMVRPAPSIDDAPSSLPRRRPITDAPQA